MRPSVTPNPSSSATPTSPSAALFAPAQPNASGTASAASSLQAQLQLALSPAFRGAIRQHLSDEAAPLADVYQRIAVQCFKSLSGTYGPAARSWQFIERVCLLIGANEQALALAKQDAFPLTHFAEQIRCGQCTATGAQVSAWAAEAAGAAEAVVQSHP